MKEHPFDFEPLDKIVILHEEAGKTLYTACTGEMFPCDVVALSILDRSLILIKGFKLIVESGGYSAAVCLLRAQLDNLLRFNGILHAHDPHDVAHQVMAGKRLSAFKDRSNVPMKDHRLVEILGKNDPSIKAAYELASGYIHLSSEHSSHLLARCSLKADGTRDFGIGDDEDHVPQDYKDSLVAAFVVISRAVPGIVVTWSEVRPALASNEELRVLYTRRI